MSPLPFSSSADFFLLAERNKMKAQERKNCNTLMTGKESWTGEDRCMDCNGSDVSDELVSLVTAWASFVKPGAG